MLLADDINTIFTNSVLKDFQNVLKIKIWILTLMVQS